MSAIVERARALSARGFAALPDAVARRSPAAGSRSRARRSIRTCSSRSASSGSSAASSPRPVEEVRAKRRATPAHSPARGSRSGSVERAARSRARQGRSARGSTRPRDVAEPAPLIVYYHGGGHVICDLDTHDQPCRFLAREVPALVLSVDYRLGPEHRFPAAVDDSLAAFEWAHAEAERLGADPDRIAVAGDSAGGNLATVVAQLAAAGDGPRAALPGADLPGHRLLGASAPSYSTFAEGFFLTREEMDWFRDNYFASPDDRTDPRASPILAEDLAGVAAGPRRHRRLRPAARRGRGLRRGAARRRRRGDPAARARPRARVHQRGRPRRPLARGDGRDRGGDPGRALRPRAAAPPRPSASSPTRPSRRRASCRPWPDGSRSRS